MKPPNITLACLLYSALDVFTQGLERAEHADIKPGHKLGDLAPTNAIYVNPSVVDSDADLYIT
jgi:hypothetical protein